MHDSRVVNNVHSFSLVTKVFEQIQNSQLSRRVQLGLNVFELGYDSQPQNVPEIV